MPRNQRLWTALEAFILRGSLYDLEFLALDTELTAHKEQVVDIFRILSGYLLSFSTYWGPLVTIISWLLVTSNHLHQAADSGIIACVHMMSCL